MPSDHHRLPVSVDGTAARAYVAAFFKSLAKAGSISDEPFFNMAEEAATPGGLNEQTHRAVQSNGGYDLVLDQLDAIYNRLTGSAATPRPYGP